VALVGWALAAATGGVAHDVGRAVFIVGLVVWGVEEVVSGANWLRRLLGTAVLVWLVVGLTG
jgi:hypothetical protein